MTAENLVPWLSLDARTLALAAMVAIGLQSLAMAYVWYVQFRQREVAELAVGSFVIVLGAALGYARPHLPPLMTQVVALMVMTAGQAIVAYAIALFVGWRVPVVLVPAAEPHRVRADSQDRMVARTAARSAAVAARARPGRIQGPERHPWP
jgi:hypothetical protein